MATKTQTALAIPGSPELHNSITTYAGLTAAAGQTVAAMTTGKTQMVAQGVAAVALAVLGVFTNKTKRSKR